MQSRGKLKIAVFPGETVMANESRIPTNLQVEKFTDEFPITPNFRQSALHWEFSIGKAWTKVPWQHTLFHDVLLQRDLRRVPFEQDVDRCNDLRTQLARVWRFSKMILDKAKEQGPSLLAKSCSPAKVPKYAARLNVDMARLQQTPFPKLKQ